MLSNTLLIYFQNQSHHEAVAQTDFVPTISLLLGSPIPFSNLGTIIIDLFNNSVDHQDVIQRKIAAELHIINALKLNANQVRRFIQTYASVSDEFSASLLLELETKFINAEAELSLIVEQLHGGNDVMVLNKLHKIRDQYLIYLSTIRMMCQEVWAKFDLSLMTLGIVLTVCSIVLSVYWLLSITADSPFRWQPIVIGCIGSFWMMSLISLIAIVHLSLMDTIISLMIACGFMIVFGIMAVKLTVDWENIISFPLSLWHIEFIPAFVIIVYGLSLFSNSYIVFEDAVSSYLLQSLVTYSGWCIVCRLQDQSKTPQKTVNKKQRTQPFDIIRQLTSPVSLTVFLVLLVNLTVRLSSIFRVCREEQWTCEPSSWALPISALTEDVRQYKTFRYFISIGCLVCFPLIINKWLQYLGNLNGYTPCVLGMKYLMPAGTVSLALYWALQAMPSKLFDDLPVWQITIFPRVVYVVVIGLFICLVWNPLCLFLMPRSAQNYLPMTSLQSSNILPQMYNHLKANWKKHMRSTSIPAEAASHNADDEPPIVYGLATVFSASHIVLISSLVLLLFMLLGDNFSPSVFLWIATVVLLLELNASLVQVSEKYSKYYAVDILLLLAI